MTPWWTDEQAGLIGGIGGSALGILGGILGTVAGFCAPRGKCKRLVFGLCIFMISIGIISLTAGVIALSSHQPYGVYYPLLLMGIICTAALGGGMPVIRRQYREADN